MAQFDPYAEQPWPPPEWAPGVDPGTAQVPEMPPGPEEQSLFAEPAPETMIPPLALDAAPPPAMQPEALPPIEPEFALPEPWQGSPGLPGYHGAAAELPSLDVAELAPPPEQAPEPFSQDPSAELIDPYSEETQQAVVDAEVSGLEAMTPEERDVYLVRKEQEKQAHELELREQKRKEWRDEGLRLQQDVEEAARVATEKRIAIEQDAAELARREPDATRWFSGGAAGGTLRVIGSLLGSALGGVNAARTGHNQALASILQMVEQDVQQQADQIRRQGQSLETQRGAVAEEYARHLDLNRAKAAAHAATLQFLEDEVAADMAQYDPAGETARQRFTIIQGIRSKRAQALDAAQRQAAKDQLDYAEALRKQEKHMADMAKADVDLRKGAADATLAERKLVRGPSRPKPLSPDQQLKLIEGGFLPYLDGQGQVIRDPEFKGTPGDPLKAAQLTKAQAEATKAQREVDEIDRVRAVPGIALKDGKPALFRDAQEAKEIAKQKAATDDVARLLDQLIVAREEHGWSSDLVKSPEWQQMKADYGQLILKGKDANQLGVMSDSDRQLLGEVMGTSDPTEVRDPGPGLKAARSNAVNSFNSTLRSTVGDVARYEPPKLAKAKAYERSKDEILSATFEVPKFAETDPDARRDFVAQHRANAEVLAKHKKPSWQEIQKLGKGIRSGNLSREEAEQVLAPLAPRIGEVVQQRIQGMSAKELAAKQRDPEFLQWVTLSNLARTGAATPADIYNAVVGIPDAAEPATAPQQSGNSNIPAALRGMPGIE